MGKVKVPEKPFFTKSQFAKSYPKDSLIFLLSHATIYKQFRKEDNMSDFDESIIDATKPNAGRIYDYFLGGHHHFEIDRQMAENLKKQAPFIPKLAIMIRWFVGEGTRQALEQGFTQFLDYASGLPTVNHIHTFTPGGTKIVYSDIDPVTVKLGKKIIGENPYIKYEHCDAATPENLIDSDVVKSLFGNNHKVTIGYNGIFWFLQNEQIKHAMEILYDWADKGSMLYFTDYDSEEELTGEAQALWKLYKQMNMIGDARSKKELIELVKPWKVKDPGFLTIEEWRGLSPVVTQEAIDTWGGRGHYGGFLVK